MKTIRNNGAVGALLDEYEKAITELKSLIASTSIKDLITIVDPDTDDPDCKSIQTILSHVVSSGYTYVIEIRKSLGEKTDFVNPVLLTGVQQYESALDKMLAYNEKLFEDYPELKLETYKCEEKMLVSWGQYYDVEQLFEHAIVHVLRHRRQIECFLLKLDKPL